MHSYAHKLYLSFKKYALSWPHWCLTPMSPVFYQFLTSCATNFVWPNSTHFDIIRTFVHALLTVPDPRESLELLLRLLFQFLRPFQFQCPHGLELLPIRVEELLFRQSFNALMGLSCYVSIAPRKLPRHLFQFPHGLELLPFFSTSLR